MKEARNTERYDIAIIGTGPAGVSAALTAKNRNKSILLLGSRQMSEKVAKAHEIRKGSSSLKPPTTFIYVSAFEKKYPARFSRTAKIKFILL